MDDEKIQRTIEFIIDNQAQFTADVLTLQDIQKLSEKRISTLEKVSLNLYNEVRETTRNVNQLTERQKELTSDVKELREAQKETNERLDAVITVFEKYLDNQNGKSK